MTFPVGSSVFGVTAQPRMPIDHGFPTASLDQTVPFGGLYGDGRFGYSLPDQVAPSGSCE